MLMIGLRCSRSGVETGGRCSLQSGLHAWQLPDDDRKLTCRQVAFFFCTSGIDQMGTRISQGRTGKGLISRVGPAGGLFDRGRAPLASWNQICRFFVSSLTVTVGKHHTCGLFRLFRDGRRGRTSPRVSNCGSLPRHLLRSKRGHQLTRCSKTLHMRIVQAFQKKMAGQIT
jgi:hypothetical protein